MNTSTNVMLYGLLRHALTLGGGALVSKGIMDEQTAGQSVEVIAGALSAIAGVGWSIWAKKSKAAPGAVVPATTLR